MLIIDLYYGNQPLGAKDIDLLRYKRNGARRLVIAYMSIGEAEDYRNYWKAEWKQDPPAWMDEINEAWEGNYQVKYWSKEWQDLLYGHSDSYLDLILAANFDGAFLDVVDAYEYFKEKEQ